MSFRTNDSQQLSFSDTLYGLTPREQKALQNSWAKVFAEDIFPNIDEQRFSVLYSDKASRPNTPVNVIVGALIIKELFGISDDMVVENLMLDPRYQYALHTTSFEEQPLSDKSLTRFRLRCYNYEQVHGVDLLSGMVKDDEDRWPHPENGFTHGGSQHPKAIAYGADLPLHFRAGQMAS